MTASSGRGRRMTDYTTKCSFSVRQFKKYWLFRYTMIPNVSVLGRIAARHVLEMKNRIIRYSIFHFILDICLYDHPQNHIGVVV